ncbi:hypothetical protein [Paraclostridium bifermentans]|uniref:hypothetical protein n=1 Tax=Paraclostridium bifermentans TaxID=1490 RepID=UPI0021C25B63|nr:hypothetical protein [Paraclostridium bifermentans]
MDALKYENFVTKAFGNINKGNDPAGIARADIFNLSYRDEYFNKLKAAIAYSIAIYNSNFSNHKKLSDPKDYLKMDSLLKESLLIKNTEEAINLINEYNKFKVYAEELPNNE